MSRLCILVVVLAFLATGSRVEAQHGGYYGGGGGYHSSTALEGGLRGMGAAVRAAGDYNLSTSEAAINREQARSMYLENRVQATSTYFQMRQMNRDYRAAERGPRITQEQANRNAADRAPDRMAKTNLDPLTGDLVWPIVLQLDLFADLRGQIETQFYNRALSDGAIGADSFFKIQQLTEEMTALLKEHVAEIPPQGYSEAKRFLKSLSYESRFPVT